MILFTKLRLELELFPFSLIFFGQLKKFLAECIVITVKLLRYFKNGDHWRVNSFYERTATFRGYC